MFSSDHARSSAHHVAIIITDGESEEPASTAEEALTARKKGIRLFAIGVGDKVNRKELYNIASSEDLVFTVDGYGALDSLRNILAWKACPGRNTSVTVCDNSNLNFLFWRFSHVKLYVVSP